MIPHEEIISDPRDDEIGILLVELLNMPRHTKRYIDLKKYNR